MMKAVRTTETSVCSDATWRYILDGSNLYTHRRENLKSHERNYSLLNLIDLSISIKVNILFFFRVWLPLIVVGELHNEELYNLYSSPDTIRQIKANEVGRACGTHGRGEKIVQGFGGKA
jgi:hypothetical protein